MIFERVISSRYLTPELDTVDALVVLKEAPEMGAIHYLSNKEDYSWEEMMSKSYPEPYDEVLQERLMRESNNLSKANTMVIDASNTINIYNKEINFKDEYKTVSDEAFSHAQDIYFHTKQYLEEGDFSKDLPFKE